MIEKKLRSSSRINFYTFKDYLVQGLHLAAAATIAGIAGVWAGPYIFAGAALAATGVTLLGYAFIDKFAPEHLKRRRLGFGTRMGLAQIFDEFTHKAGLKKVPHLYDFSYKKTETKSLKWLPRSLRHQFQAAATGLKKPVVIVSEPLLKNFTLPELRSVIAHEFAHLGADHIKIKMAMRALGITSRVCTAGAIFAAIFSGGWLWGLGALAGTIAMITITDKLVPTRAQIYKPDGTVDPVARRMYYMFGPLRYAAVLGCMAIPNPPLILGTWAIAKWLNLAKSYVEQIQSRRHEFQADRTAVTMGGDPLGLITSLRKLQRSFEIRIPALGPSGDWRQGTWYERAHKLIRTLQHTHPNVDQRSGRLAHMAAKKGYSDAQITNAMTAPIDDEPLKPSAREILERDEKPFKPYVFPTFLRKPVNIAQKSFRRSATPQTHKEKAGRVDNAYASGLVPA